MSVHASEDCDKPRVRSYTLLDWHCSNKFYFLFSSGFFSYFYMWRKVIRIEFFVHFFFKVLNMKDHPLSFCWPGCVYKLTIIFKTQVLRDICKDYNRKGFSTFGCRHGCWYISIIPNNTPCVCCKTWTIEVLRETAQRKSSDKWRVDKRKGKVVEGELIERAGDLRSADRAEPLCGSHSLVHGWALLSTVVRLVD